MTEKIHTEMNPALADVIAPHAEPVAKALAAVFDAVMASEHGSDDQVTRTNEAISGMTHVLACGVVITIAKLMEAKAVDLSPAFTAIMGDIDIRTQYRISQSLAVAYGNRVNPQ